MMDEHLWYELDDSTQAMLVPGGMIIRSYLERETSLAESMVFVPGAAEILHPWIKAWNETP